MTLKEFYETSDIDMATTLITLRFPLENIDFQIEGNKPVGYFQFEDTEDLQLTIKKYRRRELAVEPMEQNLNKRSLQAQLKTIYKGPHSPFN